MRSTGRNGVIGRSVRLAAKTELLRYPRSAAPRSHQPQRSEQRGTEISRPGPINREDRRNQKRRCDKPAWSLQPHNQQGRNNRTGINHIIEVIAKHVSECFIRKQIGIYYARMLISETTSWTLFLDLKFQLLIGKESFFIFKNPTYWKWNSENIENQSCLLFKFRRNSAKKSFRIVETDWLTWPFGVPNPNTYWTTHLFGFKLKIR
jgi:hypothetical protein